MMSGRPEHIVMGLSQYKTWIEVTSPFLFKLYSAGWRSGFTVNGMRP